MTDNHFVLVGSGNIKRLREIIRRTNITPDDLSFIIRNVEMDCDDEPTWPSLGTVSELADRLASFPIAQQYRDVAYIRVFFENGEQNQLISKLDQTMRIIAIPEE